MSCPGLSWFNQLPSLLGGGASLFLQHFAGGSTSQMAGPACSSAAGLAPRAPAGEATACGIEYFSIGKSIWKGVWYAWCDVTQERVALPMPTSQKYDLDVDEDGDPVLQDGSDISELLPLFKWQSCATQPWFCRTTRPCGW